jgi:hypothetical protein
MKKKLTRTLDLHGVKHSEVDKLLENFYFWKGKINDKSIIITGDSSDMQKIVLKFLNINNFSYIVPTYNSGIIEVIG